MKTLEESQRFVRNHRTDKGGVKCPCCSQLVKVYRRGLNPTMVMFLIALTGAYRKTRQAVHVDALADYGFETKLASGGDYAKVVYWGLAKQTGKAGYWRPTQRGVDFLKGTERVPRYAVVCTGELLGLTGPAVTPAAVFAKSKRFNFAALMAAVDLQDLA